MAYDYLKPYMSFNYRDIVEISKQNVFYSIDFKEIDQSEKRMGIKFPTQLRKFYESIGFGHLTTPHKPPLGYNFYNPNVILPPNSAACFYKGKLVDDYEEYYMSEDTYEMLEEGDLPFFEIGDGSSFMVMKLNSDNPNAVWSDCGVKIEDSFERFIWRLYYEDPGYYGEIIEDYYKDK